jgi:hypothetical protein
MPTFILGAGFNVDANTEAGPIFGESLYIGRYQIDCSYPLAGETLNLCFGLEALPAGKSIEDLFAEAQARGDYGPITKLADRLRETDFRIATRLASDKDQNCYRKFFQAFGSNNFLTFNYDAFVETFLLCLGRWYPHDGFGLQVAVSQAPGPDVLAGKKSDALVLHLHGSLCIQTHEYEITRGSGEAMPFLKERDEPLYAFEPLSVSANFAPFHGQGGADDVEERTIAPVPDKSQGLKQTFIRDTYAKAEALLRASDIVVAIGYSFNAHDRASYERLLCAMSASQGRKLLVVSPDAANIANALRPTFPSLSVQPVEATFKQWVAELFTN